MNKKILFYSVFRSIQIFKTHHNSLSTPPSLKVGETFLAKMQDKNWKLRKEAMDELKDIISSAKFVSANVGGLGPVLASRFTDTNKIISVQGRYSVLS